MITQPTTSVLITGACGDIGRALAAEFAASGCNRIALCDLASEAEALVRLSGVGRTGVRLLYRRVDVTDPGAVAAFVAEADRELDGIDLCIANAGIVERGRLIELTPDAWHRTLDVNLTGAFLTAQAAAKAMLARRRPGHVLMLGSWVQDVPRETIGAYCASKAGLQMLAKCLTLELGPDRIRVNVVAPGFVDAGLTARNLEAHPERRAAMEDSIPLGRLIPAEELARAVRLFCSPDAAYVTGTTLLVDGGSSLFFHRSK